jgi:hypothetical protein
LRLVLQRSDQADSLTCTSSKPSSLWPSTLRARKASTECFLSSHGRAPPEILGRRSILEIQHVRAK